LEFLNGSISSQNAVKRFTVHSKPMAYRSNTDAAVRRREKVASLLSSKEEQQRLTVERTQRLLNNGKPPPIPPQQDLLKTRAVLRDEVSNIVEKNIIYSLSEPGNHKDMTAEAAARYAHQVEEIKTNDVRMGRARASLENRVEYRDYLNAEFNDDTTERDLAESARISKKADEVIGTFVKAEWMLTAPEEEELRDLDRERRLYDEAKGVLTAAPEMRDFELHHRGAVVLPPAVGGRSDVETVAFLAAIKARDAAAKRLGEGRERAAQAQASAIEAEEGARALAAALEKRGRSMGFDERLRERKKMLVAKAHADALVATADHERAAFEDLQRETAAEGASVGGSGAGEGALGGGYDEFQSGPRIVVLWLIGFTDGDTVGKVFYGAYAASDLPPDAFWLPFLDEERGAGLTVKVAGGGGAGPSVTLEGARDPQVCGRFSADGRADGVAKFTNPDGVSVFRARLHESRDLDITVAALDKDAPGPHRAARLAAAKSGRPPKPRSKLGGLEGRHEGGGGEDDERTAAAARGRTLDVFDMAGERLEADGFGPLRSVGLRMVIVGLRDQAARRQAHRAHVERLAEAQFEVRTVGQGVVSACALVGRGSMYHSNQQPPPPLRRKMR
jgi:hypothetical protein